MKKKYPQSKDFNFNEIEKNILKFWKENNIFKKSLENKNKKNFIFYEGPPSANGAPGIHHVLSRTIKDIICRYKTMKGFKVDRKAGWDAHGLPVELKVEKNLNITKKDIGKKISIDQYNNECRKTVMEFKDQWDSLTEQMGYWVDLKNPYITFDNDYIESVWYLIKKLYEKNLIYKGFNIQPYSPAAGTGLSSHELNMPGCYRMVKDISITAQFKLVNSENEFFLAWTTTPWTLPANTALAINSKLDYVKIETFNKYTYSNIKVILAEKAISRYFDYKCKTQELHLSYNEKEHKENIPWKILEKIPGKDLLKKEYEQLMPYVIPKGKCFEIIHGDFVNTEDGTGIVHIAPTFGADDMKIAKENNISSIFVKNDNNEDVPIVDAQGKFVKQITDFAGKYVKEDYEIEKIKSKSDYLSTDILISIKLKKENKAFKVEKYEHSYPHCWRTDKPILYYPLSSWYIRTTQYKNKLIEKNKEINWVPESVGKGRFGDWLNNLVDWNFSRSRFWGIPLPIWKTKDGKELIVIGSCEELNEKIKESIKKGIMHSNPLREKFDLHKPYIDEVILVSKNNKKMYREKDVIDVWFDSGSMPYAQKHYPFQKKENFENYFPADFIAEGVDQTRGWFFTLHTISVLLFDSVAFKNVIVNGLVLDKKGNKMSKRLGNSVNPFNIIKEYGSDVLRWYMIKNSNPWENLKFDEEELLKVRRKFFNTLENIYNFFALYANIDSFSYENFIKTPISKLDRWIISKVNSLIKNTKNLFNDYDLTKAVRLIQDFVINDLSNWYVRLNRKRFWKSENNSDKLIAYQTLYDCLISIAKISSPISPFYMEYLYRNLNNTTRKELPESIHLCSFPIENNELIDEDLEKKMSRVQSIVSLIHSLRKQNKIKVRQPLSRILIPILNTDDSNFIENMKDIILEETNIKKIEFIDSTKNILKKKLKLNFPKVGKKYKDYIKFIKEKIDNFTQDEIRLFEKEGHIKIYDNFSKEILLEKGDLILVSEDIPGWSVLSDGKNTIALDITLNNDLIMEGISREIINKVQNIRKDINLDVQDKIKIFLTGDDFVLDTLRKYKNHICKETQANILLIDHNTKENLIKFDKHFMNIRIEKVDF